MGKKQIAQKCPRCNKPSMTCTLVSTRDAKGHEEDVARHRCADRHSCKYEDPITARVEGSKIICPLCGNEKRRRRLLPVLPAQI